MNWWNWERRRFSVRAWRIETDPKVLFDTHARLCYITSVWSADVSESSMQIFAATRLPFID